MVRNTVYDVATREFLHSRPRYGYEQHMGTRWSQLMTATLLNYVRYCRFRTGKWPCCVCACRHASDHDGALRPALTCHEPRNYLFVTYRLWNAHATHTWSAHGRLPRSPEPSRLHAAAMRRRRVRAAARVHGGSSGPETVPARSAWLGGFSRTCQHKQGRNESPEGREERADMGVHAGSVRFERSAHRRCCCCCCCCCGCCCCCCCWLAGWVQRPAPELRESARSRRSSHADALIDEESRANKSTM